MGFRRSPETTTRQGRTFRAVREYVPFHAEILALGHAGPRVARAQGRGRRHATMRHTGEHRGTFREKPAFLKRLCELVWVGGCVTAPAAWASGPSALASWGPWGRRRRGTRGRARSRERPCVTRRSVHRLAKITSRSRSGAFVYTVATLWTDVGTQECTQIGEDGPSAPFRGIRVHCCVASRDTSCVGWHERPNRHGVPAALLGGRLSLGQ